MMFVSMANSRFYVHVLLACKLAIAEIVIISHYWLLNGLINQAIQIGRGFPDEGS